MASETGIANAALRLIGGERITSFTDGSKNANVIQDCYAEVRDDLLRSHDWNFATKRQKLARSSTAPAFGFDYAYTLPSDWLRTVSVHDNDAGTGTFVYKTEQVGDQRVIVCDAEDVYLRYVAQVTDPNMMPADFRRALEFALARDIAVPIASSNTLEDQLAKRTKSMRAKAMSTDAMGSFPDPRPRGSWADSRGGGWPGRWPR